MDEFRDAVRPASAATSVGEWVRLEGDPGFRELVRRKRRFIVPATIFFILYYFALPVLVGYFPELMDTPVFGGMNVAYLFALSQFFMAWAVMWLYVRRARDFDSLAAKVVARAGEEAER
jgi:uncharacterized membrane protein (DUF485 family)